MNVDYEKCFVSWWESHIQQAIELLVGGPNSDKFGDEEMDQVCFGFFFENHGYNSFPGLNTISGSYLWKSAENLF